MIEVLKASYTSRTRRRRCVGCVGGICPRPRRACQPCSDQKQHGGERDGRSRPRQQDRLDE